MTLTATRLGQHLCTTKADWTDGRDTERCQSRNKRPKNRLNSQRRVSQQASEGSVEARDAGLGHMTEQTRHCAHNTTTAGEAQEAT